MLRTFARNLLEAAAKADQSAQIPAIGTLTAISQLPTPVYGEVDGHPVTVTADGNMHGFSPVRQCVDLDGEVAWIPTDRILMTDPRLQPVAPAARTAGASAAETATRSRKK